MIVVTAPTGLIGHQVLEGLLAAGEDVRVVVRDPGRLPEQTRDQVEVVTGSHGDARVVSQAFAGADAVFWLVPPNPQATSVESAYLDFTRPAAEALSSSAVSNVVGVSALGRGTAEAGHAGFVTASLTMDDLIADSGVAYRALTLPSFMDNIARQAALIRDQGMFTSPIRGEVSMPTVATRDIASVAVRLLTDRGWEGFAEVPVLGPEDLSFEDMADIMTDVLGTPVRFQQVPPGAYKERMMSFGTSDAMAQGLLDMAMAKDAGLDHGVERTPETSTPTSFRTWCEEVLVEAVRA